MLRTCHLPSNINTFSIFRFFFQKNDYDSDDINQSNDAMKVINEDIGVTIDVTGVLTRLNKFKGNETFIK